MKGRSVAKWSLICLLVIVLGGTVGAMSYIFVSVKQFDQVLAQNLAIEGIPVGGMTPAQARELLEPKCQAYLNTKGITLARGAIKVTLNLKDLSAAYQLDQTLEQAYAIGHDRGLLDRYALATGRHQLAPVNLKIDYTFDESKVPAWVASCQAPFEKKPVDATITRANRKFNITPEQPGEALDVAVTSERVIACLRRGELGAVIEAAVQPTTPAITAESLKVVQNPVASFQTSYNNADPSRNQNLKVAARKINKVVAPGAVFSLGEQLEPITFEEGFRPSKVIVNGQLEDGIGGGVCQVASTLYNAILLTNLDITMRQNHSLPVAYVPLGRDATYASGMIDFKFKNNTEYPVFVESYCEDNKVVVNVFGHQILKPEYDEIKFYSETIEVIPAPPTKYVEDEILELGKQIQKVSAQEGKKVKLYKMCYKNGDLVHKELINQSYYRERAALVRVGTKPIPQAPNVPMQNEQDPLESFMGMEAETTVEPEKQLGND
ncbi:MAG: VanW family protein [Cellulosilyticaceae bacterium]